MIGIPGPLLIAVLLLMLMVLVWAKGLFAARELASRSGVLSPDDESKFALCSPELVPRIFSRQDSEFVSATRSPQLQRLFRRDRKAVALLWIQQTSAAIQRIMREHKQVSRSARDLDFSTEVKLVSQYASLMLICGVLYLVIQVAGPMRLLALAVYADSLSQHIAQAEQAFQAATTDRTVTVARSS
jgi:hypothetical protein